MNLRYSIYTFILTIVCFLVSCKDENDIGDLYGQWQITSIQSEGATLTPTRAFLAFQNDCVFARLTEVDDHYTVAITGGFRQTADSISLNFYIEDIEGADVLHQYLSVFFSFPEPHDNIRLGFRQIDSRNITFSHGDKHWQMRSY